MSLFSKSNLGLKPLAEIEEIVKERRGAQEPKPDLLLPITVLIIMGVVVILAVIVVTLSKQKKH